MADQDMERQKHQWYEMLHLDEDEQEHLKQVSSEVVKWCSLANVGALLAASCITWTPTLHKAETSSPEFIRALLTIKCANLLRLSTTAIFTGYYSGAAMLLRGAFESLAYLHLFADNPEEIGLWLKVELHPDYNIKQRDKERQHQFKRAKKSFARHAPHKQRELEVMRFLWDKSSRNIHSSAVELAQTFGLDFTDFLPDEFWAAFQKGGEDWGWALDVMSLKAIDGRAWSSTRYGQAYSKEESIFAFLGCYDENEAFLLSELALFLTHRLADFVFTLFEVTYDDLKTDFKKWHEQVKQL